MSSLVVSLIAFAVMMAGALLGAYLRRALPDQHLDQDAKDVIRLGSGLVGTMAALVLGLLIASAKSSFDAQSSQVRQMTASILLLDRLLANYGPEARPVRALLRGAVGPLVERVWREHSSEATKAAPFDPSAAAEMPLIKLQELSPQNDVQQALKARAVQASTDLAQARLLLFAQANGSIPMPFLAVLLFWLAIIFASFSLFSRLNPTLVVLLCVFALSASAAIFLILELGQPFSGLLQISSAPVRHALAPLEP